MIHFFHEIKLQARIDSLANYFNDQIEIVFKSFFRRLNYIQKLKSKPASTNNQDKPNYLRLFQSLKNNIGKFSFFNSFEEESSRTQQLTDLETYLLKGFKRPKIIVSNLKMILLNLDLEI